MNSVNRHAVWNDSQSASELTEDRSTRRTRAPSRLPARRPPSFGAFDLLRF